MDTPHRGRVAELDGIRALAVTAVLIYHLEFPWLPGGFLGVDVFFVLSGYLIATLLLGELRRTGRIDLFGFWSRRARRLFPAMIVLFIALIGYAATRLPEAQLSLRKDLLAAIAYVANWHFVLEGRSYFAEFQAASPIRHLWSLAVEEQFYLLLPLLLLGLAMLGIRSKWRVGGLLLASSIMASIVVQAILYQEADPSRVYYGTDARAHELLIGVALAWLLSEGTKQRIRAHAPAFAGAGLLALLLMFALMDDRGPFYYRGGSTLVSLAACLLISGLSSRPGHGLVARVLATRPMAGLGRISYGFYLWHWPVIAIVTAESVPLDGPVLIATQILVPLLVSIASYRAVERPIQRDGLRWVSLTPTRLFGTVLASAVLLASGVVAVTWNGTPEPDYVRQQDGLVVARDADPADPVIGLVGDSIAVSLQKALAEEGTRRGYTIVSAARPGCGVGSSLLLDETGHPFAIAPVCVKRTPRLQEQLVERFHPQIVVWHSARDRTDIRMGGRTIKAGSPEWISSRLADWNATLDRLARPGTRVVVVLPVWSATASGRTACGGEFNFDPQGCGLSAITTEHLRRLYRQWASTRPGRVSLVDLAEVACPQGLPCPEKLSGVRLRDDEVHFSPAGARLLTGRLLDLILSASRTTPQRMP